MIQHIVQHPECQLVLVDYDRILEVACQQTHDSLLAELGFERLDCLELFALLVVLFANVVLEFERVLCALADHDCLALL